MTIKLGRQWRIGFHMPLVYKDMDGYDIRQDTFVRGRFALYVCFGDDFSHLGGVGRLEWFPFLIWAWSPPLDGTPITSAEARFS